VEHMDAVKNRLEVLLRDPFSTLRAGKWTLQVESFLPEIALLLLFAFIALVSNCVKLLTYRFQIGLKFSFLLSPITLLLLLIPQLLHHSIRLVRYNLLLVLHCLQLNSPHFNQLLNSHFELIRQFYILVTPIPTDKHLHPSLLLFVNITPYHVSFILLFELRQISQDIFGSVLYFQLLGIYVIFF